MFSLRRVVAVAAVLGVAACITCSHLWGEPTRDKELKDAKDGNKAQLPEQFEAGFADDLVFTRFGESPLVVYQSTKDEYFYALQVKPTLPDAKEQASRPRDYLVVIDTSASKTGGHLLAAQKLAETLITKM